jgi:hypothetical protein
MMTFKYKGKEYEIQEPTVETWSKLILLQEWTDEREFCIKLISQSTGLTEEEIENSDWTEVVKVSNLLSQHFLKDGKDFVNEFEFNNKIYRFLDLPNLTFGEFIDIDTYLAKEPHEKKKEMNLLMAMLYREVDSKGDYIPYDSKNLQKKAEEFKKLPVKYVNGATSFFLRLEKTLRGNFKASFTLKLKLMIKMIWLVVKFSVLISIGGGLVLLSNWRKRISRRLKK